VVVYRELTVYTTQAIYMIISLFELPDALDSKIEENECSQHFTQLYPSTDLAQF
jgi:hypothetical protein